MANDMYVDLIQKKLFEANIYSYFCSQQWESGVKIQMSVSVQLVFIANVIGVW